jgi:hypothetical protein
MFRPVIRPSNTRRRHILQCDVSTALYFTSMCYSAIQTQSTRYCTVSDSTIRRVDQDYVQGRSKTLVGRGASHVASQCNPGWWHINGPSAHQKPVGNDLWTGKQLPTKLALLPVLGNLSFRVELATLEIGTRIQLLICLLTFASIILCRNILMGQSIIPDPYNHITWPVRKCLYNVALIEISSSYFPWIYFLGRAMA